MLYSEGLLYYLSEGIYFLIFISLPQLFLFYFSTDRQQLILEDSVDPSPRSSHVSSASSHAEEEIKLLNNAVDTNLQNLYECANCAFTFNRREAFIRHLKLRKTRCSNCCQQTIDNGKHQLKPLVNRNRTQHMLTWYKSNYIERVECDDCQSECYKLGKPTDLKKLFKSVAAGPRQCDLCPKRYLTRRRLAEHMRLHTGERPYRCAACNKSFNYKFNLVAHRAYHRSVLNYQCVYCLRNFTPRVAANTMIQSYVNAERQKCEVCHKTADVLDTLAKRYMPGPKTHECIWCSMRFTSVKTWIKHVQKNHVQKQHVQKQYVRKQQMLQNQPKHSWDPLVKHGNETFANKMGVNETAVNETAVNKTAVNKTAVNKATAMVTGVNETMPPRTKYTCKYCSLQFNKKYLMDIHKKIHLDPSTLNSANGNCYMDDDGNLNTICKIYECLTCNLTYASLKSLKHHISIKHRNV